MKRLTTIGLAQLALAFRLCAAEPSATWTTTREMPAPEAFQAAAADERHVYAIASTVVAKYDRDTGRQLAESTGDARHLNSGFLWQGQLYCAHSNYPQTPERSEIKLLDPATMRLTTYKDFGDFGGSLTWAVVHQGHWYCNFARYGDDNGQTALVKFDPQWNELARWTYPPEVIKQLGRYSLSGGVWRDGELFTTDHDHPVLYRLRLPREGGELEYIGKDTVPFTGQGIANDPRTGGLVGIDRARRRVVFAELMKR